MKTITEKRKSRLEALDEALERAGFTKVAPWGRLVARRETLICGVPFQAVVTVFTNWTARRPFVFEAQIVSEGGAPKGGSDYKFEGLSQTIATRSFAKISEGALWALFRIHECGPNGPVVHFEKKSTSAGTRKGGS